jgi:K+-sensing histidine kinase KdpD
MTGLRNRLQEQAAASHLEAADPAILRDYYQSVLDSVGSVIYTVNRDLRITGVNRHWDDFALETGNSHLTRHNILGSHLLDQMTGVPLERWRVVCQQLLDDKIPRYLDEIASEEPYTWRHFSLRATPLRDGRGEILGITFVATNITQLKKAEYEMFQRLVEIRGLRQVAQTAGTWIDRRRVFKQITSDIAHLFDAEKCVIFLWDEHSGNLQARDPAFGLAGRKLSELSLDMGHPADQDSLWQDLEEKEFILLNEGDEAPADMVETSARVDRLAAMLGILRVSARIHGAILVAGRARPFTEQDGQLLGLFAVPTALSIENFELNQRLLDRAQQLTTTRQQLDELIRMKEGIRLPLSVIRSYVELLYAGDLEPMPEMETPVMQTILDKTTSIMELIDQTTPLSFPHDATRYERVNLADLVKQTVEQRKSLLQQTGISTTLDLPQEDAGNVILCDPDLMSRAFDALLEGLIRLSARGGNLQIALRTSDDILYVEFSGSAIDIPADHLMRIWKAPARSGAMNTVNLAEVKRIVEGHGGQVWAENPDGRDCTFHIVLRRPDY